MSYGNPSFEFAGGDPGEADVWDWNRSVPFNYSVFATLPDGDSRNEGFEAGWGADNFISALVIPTNASPFQFNAPLFTTVEGFERGWRAPNSHAVVQSGLANPFSNVGPFALADGETLNFTINGQALAVTFSTAQFANIAIAQPVEVVLAINDAIGDAGITDAFAFFTTANRVSVQTEETGSAASIVVAAGTANAALGYVVGTYVGGVNTDHLGNETALFAFPGGEAATFSFLQYPPLGINIEDFERGWPTNEHYFTAFSQVASATAAFSVTVFDPPNGIPVENFEGGWKDNQDYEFTMGSTSPFVFQPGSVHVESFEAVKADQLMSADHTASTFTAAAHGFSNGDQCSIYAGTLLNGTAGLIPTGINSALTFFIINKTTNTFQIAQTSGGTAITFSDNGSGPLYVKANPALFWTNVI